MPQGKHQPRPLQEPAPWEVASTEPEPDWAEEIRARRKARGGHLKELFAAFDDEPTKGQGRAPPGDR